MSPEIRAALLSALAENGQTELWVETLAEPFRSFFADHAAVFEGWLAALNPDPTDPIAFLYLDRPEFNACAIRAGRHRFIALNWGAVVLVHDLFFRMMSTPTVLPHIGDASVEVAPEKHSQLLLNAQELPKDEANPFGILVGPRDHVRGAYACHLARTAIDFLFIHEWQHAAGGHHGFLNGPQASEITEFHKEAWMGDLMTRHVLENEADAAAAKLTLGLACDRTGNAWRMPEPIAPFLRSDEERIGSWLFSILTLFILMEDGVSRTTGRGTHPSPLAMRAFLTVCVLTLCSPWSSAKTGDFAGQVLADVDQAIDAVAGRPHGKRFTVAHVLASREQHMVLLQRRWQELRPRLRQLAHKSKARCAPEALVEMFCRG